MKRISQSFAGAKFKRNADLIGAKLDDDLVMMSVEEGQYYGLAGVGPRIWELIYECCSFEALVEQLLEEFEVEREICETDLAEFLEQMEKLGLVERC